MPNLLSRAGLLFAFGMILSAGQIVAAPFEKLTQKLPDGANAIVLVNVEQILKSDFARSHDSKQKLEQAFEQQALLIPPDATQFVLAGQIDLEHFSRNWEAAVMELKHAPNFEQVARWTHRSIEKVGGLEAIGGTKIFALNLGDNLIGLLAPSNRQHAARWAHRVQQHTGNALPAYLAKTSSYSDTAGTDIILAIDLTDALPEKFVAERLRQNPVVKDRKVDFDKLAGTIARMQGVRLGIRFDAKSNGMLVIDLQDDPAPMAEFAKPLVLSILENCGILIEEMRDWKVKLGKQTITLQGQLTADGMRRLMSVVELPADAVVMAEAGPAGATKAAAPQADLESKKSLEREASKKYFKTVEQQLDSLRMQKKDAKSLGQIALWIDNTARRIDRLSTLNVDSELADYGASVASDLRQMTAALQGSGIRAGARKAGIWENTDSYYYDDGYDADSARRQVKAEEQAVGATSALDLSREIANKSAAIRRKMTDRYQVAF